MKAASAAYIHRYYEVQNGTHRDRWRDAPTNFLEVEYVLPHFVKSFEAMVKWVELGAGAAAEPVRAARRSDRRRPDHLRPTRAVRQTPGAESVETNRASTTERRGT